MSRSVFKLHKILIKLIHRKILTKYKIEIEVKFAVEDQVLVEFDKR